MSDAQRNANSSTESLLCYTHSDDIIKCTQTNTPLSWFWVCKQWESYSNSILFLLCVLLPLFSLHSAIFYILIITVCNCKVIQLCCFVTKGKSNIFISFCSAPQLYIYFDFDVNFITLSICLFWRKCFFPAVHVSFITIGWLNCYLLFFWSRLLPV